MHKKDKVKQVIQKYIDQGKDFFELTPSYLVTLEELKGFSERTLKRGRTEFKAENSDSLKGKSKASLNVKRKVFSYLDDNPDSTLAQLKKKFSSQDKKQITEYFNLKAKESKNKAGKKPGKKPKSNESGSLRQKVFNYLDKNPELTLSKLEKAFPEENKKTVSNYLDQWRKEKSSKTKKVSTKQQINDYLDNNQASTLKDLKKAFPDINPSSIGAYHSLWKHSTKFKAAPKGRNKATAQKVTQPASIDRNSLTVDTAKQIIDALNSTVEAQKKAIEVLRSQNSMLEEIKGYSFPELKGMSKKEIDKFERVMSTFLKGLRNS
jgi:hypothetical protein